MPLLPRQLLDLGEDEPTGNTDTKDTKEPAKATETKEAEKVTGTEKTKDAPTTATREVVAAETDDDEPTITRKTDTAVTTAKTTKVAASGTAEVAAPQTSGPGALDEYKSVQAACSEAGYTSDACTSGTQNWAENNPWIAAVIVAGVLGILWFVIWWWRRRKRAKKDKEDKKEQEKQIFDLKLAQMSKI